MRLVITQLFPPLRYSRHHPRHKTTLITYTLTYSHKTACKNWLCFPFCVIIIIIIIIIISSSKATRSSQLRLFSRPQFCFSRRCYLNTTPTDGEGRNTQDHTRRRQSTEIFKSCDLTHQNYTSVSKLAIQPVITHLISSAPKAKTKTIQGRHCYKRTRTTMRHN